MHATRHQMTREDGALKLLVSVCRGLEVSTAKRRSEIRSMDESAARSPLN